MNLGNMAKAVVIFQKYFGETEYFSAEHDQLWIGDDSVKISAEDVAILDELGWFWDDDIERWTCYI
jgi:hypothetical protein